MSNVSTTDVLLVCHNGHVVTDRLHSHPAASRSRCERCGSGVLSSCPTCGQILTIARPLSLHDTLGGKRPPDYCSACGSSFPWTREAPPPPVRDEMPDLVTALRRVPRLIREFRYRQREKPPFRIEDVRDLEDLMRGVLALFAEEVRSEARTPAYASQTRTDFLLPVEGMVVLVKQTASDVREAELQEQLKEDLASYAARPGISKVIVLIHDPEGLLRDPRQLELAWSRPDEQPASACIIAV